ncbi:MAG: amidohydrolase family protein [Rhodospirillaceae bacterium]|nr:amidohydrolase family protein [Rhodospirillales bacterium]
MPMRVDCHAHCFVQGLALDGTRRYTPSYDAGIAAYLGMLDASGMTHGVLVQPSFLGTDNSYLVSVLQVAPERLRGIAMVDPAISVEEIAQLAGQGIVGIRLNLIGKDDPDFASALWTRHLDRIAAAGWQVEVQCEAARLPRVLPPLLAAGGNVVIDHFGRPNPLLGIHDPGFTTLLAAAITKQVWVKLSAGYRLGPDGDRLAQHAAVELVHAFGPSRLLWGSDWPHTQFEQVADTRTALAALTRWLPSAAMRSRVLGSTAAGLFGFGQAETARRQSGHADTSAVKAS